MRHLIPLIAVLALGCDRASDQDTDLDEPDWPYAGYEATWSPCSLIEGEDDGLAECADLDLPLFWDDLEDDRTIAVRAKRLLAAGEADVQLWLLQGGPGGSGVWDFGPRMVALQALYPGVDVYTLDHRGTGFTERLSCAAEEPLTDGGSSITSAELPDCIEDMVSDLGDRLDAYNATYSAVDAAAYIDASREEGKRVVVWGGSYGTYWAQRYLVVAPDQADGVAIEGNLTPDETLIVTEEYADIAGRALFDACGLDEVCSAHLGEDPVAFVEDLLERMDQGHCTRTGFSAQVFSMLSAYLMYSRGGMSLVPALAWRLDRCTIDDETAAVHLYNALFGDGGTWDLESYSILLQHHITYRELWSHPDFDGVDLYAYYDEVYDDAIVAKGYGYYKADLAELWPQGTVPLDDAWPDTDTPMLIMQGELDPISSYARALPLEAHYTAPHQTFVSFPWSAHGVGFDSPVSTDPADLDCGQDLFLQFLADPTADLDQSCVDRTLPVDFDLGETYARFYFGTDDYWAN